MIVSGLVIPPLYLRMLTEEQFGLFSFLTLVNGLLILFELGFSRAISHEFASAGKDECATDLPTTLRTIEWFFLPVGILLAAILFCSAEFIAYSWLTADSEDAPLVVRLIAIVVFFRWIIIFYQAVLLGMENHIVINVGQIAYLLLVPSLGLTVLYLGAWGLVGLVLCYLAGSILLALAFGWLSWNKTGEYKAAAFCSKKARELRVFAFKVAGVAIPGIALMQIDKIVASKILGVETFGWYMLVAGVASSIAMLITPVYQVAFPRFTALLSKGKDQQFERLYRVFVQLTALMLFPVAATLAIFSKPILSLYTGKPDLAELMWPVISVLVVAKAFHASGMIPYAVQLAQKKLRLAFRINLFSLLIMVTSLPILINLFGVMGLAWSWFLVTLGYVTVGMWIFHKQFFCGGYWQWLLKDNLPAITISITCGFLVFEWFPPAANLAGLTIIIMSGIGSFLMSLMAQPSLRKQALSMLSVSCSN